MEARLSSRDRIVIPKQVRQKLGLRLGSRVRFEVVEGKRAVIQPAQAPKEVFVRAERAVVEKVLAESKDVDEGKIRRPVRARGVRALAP